MEPKQLEALENEVKVIAKICDVLKYCTFSGHMAQDVAIGQMYLQGLLSHMKTNIEGMKSESVVAEKPVAEVK